MMGLFTRSKARKRGGSDRPRGNLDVRLSARDRAAPAQAPAGRSGADAPTRNPKSRSAKKGDGGRRGRSGFARVAYWGFVLCLWGVIASIALVAWIGAHLPAIQSLEVPKRPPSIRIAGLDGRVLATRGDSGVAASLKELPKHVPQAFIAIEDRRFYDHHGVDPMGIGRALGANVMRRGVSQGGSTITQQLAKNLFLTQDRTYTRKIQELVLALWLERKFSKTEILDLYLNRIYFGAGAYGIEAAAQRYFGKPAKQLNLAEAAMLAGLVKSPSRLAPTRNPRRRRTARASGADRDDVARFRFRFESEARDRAARACAQAIPERLGQLYRRLDHGRAA